MEAREPELYAWFDALKEREQAYCASAWDAMSDPINHAEPLPREFCADLFALAGNTGCLSPFSRAGCA